MTTFFEEMKKQFNRKTTENGADAYASTLNKVYDMFAFAGAYRERTNEEVIELFREAYEENPELALKCLFWARDRAEGAGERRFFRVCLHWLGDVSPLNVKANLAHVPVYGRWDDIYALCDTQSEAFAMGYLANTLITDYNADYPSLAAKWAYSCNCSSAEHRALGQKTRKYCHMTEKEYRKMLSTIRKRLNILEHIMSAHEWDKIDFSKIPSIAGFRYAHCFKTRKELAERYEEFLNGKDVKVNAGVLYPYECVKMARNLEKSDDAGRRALDVYWRNLPDFTEGKDTSNFMCVCDTSGSMTCGSETSVQPIDVAVSLAIYFAEHAKGPLANHYISFASRPQLIEIKGKDFYEKANRIVNTNLCDNTNLERVFDLLLNIATSGNVAADEFVKNLFIISDMEIDRGMHNYGCDVGSLMERIQHKWEATTDIPFPHLYCWNVDARENTILSLSNTTFISGASPAILKTVLSGKTGYELCLEVLTSDRYKGVKYYAED